jgi:hypothetical protein
MYFKRLSAAALAAVAFTMLSVGPADAASDTSTLWQDTPNRSLPIGVTAPDAYRAVHLDLTALKSELASSGGGVGLTLSLPKPGGGFDEFVLSDSGTLPVELAAKYPEIRSFRGTDSKGHSARIDISPLGLNAMVFGHDGVWLVRPVTFGEGSDYVSFSRDDASAGREPFHCEVHDNQDPDQGVFRPTAPNTTTGVIKRNYRAAVAANHNYVETIAGSNTPTVAIGLAAVTIAMNRVNEVYENDLSIHMTLVPNNDLIIYPLAAGDPYSNGTGALNQNTGNLNTVIGSANYDIGHVFTTGSGGVAGLGVVCNASGKGRGTTGLSNAAQLISDVFYIDYVAHEMGHQFGGNHTFNNSCSSNRAASAAYEPGSGATIMAYAGICAPNLQNNSDPYFHAKSLQEITTFTTGTGGACSVTSTNNAAPVLGALSNYTIPARTPFVLEGSATSTAPGAALTFGWEQYDLGSVTVDINTDPGNGPIIRSLIPTTSPVRTIPKFSNLLTGATMVGEILPTTNRALNFRLTAFDNVAGGGTSESKDLVLTVNAASGPFAVTAPLAGASWSAGPQTVTWNVAGTDVAPVSCPTVNIDVYTAGDFTSSTATLAQGVPNTGSAVVNAPNLLTSDARVRVRCANNIFFAMNPGKFTISGSDVIFADGFEFGVIPFNPPTIAKAFAPASVSAGTPSTLTITLANNNASAATLSAALTDSFPSGLVVAATPAASTTCGGAVTAVAGAASVSLATSGSAIPANGSCTVTVSVTSATAGSYVNTIAAGALQTSAGNNTTAANATLAVTTPALVAPTIAKAFAPTLVSAGTPSTLTITLANSNASAATLSAALTDSFPSGLVIAATPAASTTCGGAVTAVAGASSVSLASASSAIPANGSCTVTVNVTSATAGSYVNTIAAGALQTSAGNNATAANATLTVTTPALVAPTIAKAFAPASVAAGAPSTLTITLANSNASAATLSAALTDSFPSGLVVAATPAASTTCGGAVTAVAGAASVSLAASGSAIPANASCTVTVNVTSAAAGSYVNTIAAGALATSAGSNAAAASATLAVTSAPTGDPFFLYSNLGTDANANYVNGATTTVSTTRYTPMVCNRLTLSQPGQQLITSFSVVLTNGNAASVTPTTAISFYDDSGASGGPGIKLGNSNDLYYGGGSYAAAIPVGKYQLNAAPFGYTATRVPAPAGGGNAKVWACVAFSSTTVTDALLSNLGLEKYVNAPTAGSTTDLAFVSTGGAAWTDNPTGTLLSTSGGTENVFGWELKTLGQNILLDSYQVIATSGAVGTSGFALNSATGVAKNFTGYAANVTAPAGTDNWGITGLILYPSCTAGNYTNVQAKLQFWDTFNGSAATDVFGNSTPIASTTVDLGAFPSCAASTLYQFPVRLPAPVVVGRSGQLGITVQYLTDTGSGLVADGSFVSALLNAPAAAPNIAVGSNASTGSTGWYRSTSNRADLNFTGSSDYVTATRQHVALRLYGEPVSAVAPLVAPTVTTSFAPATHVATGTASTLTIKLSNTNATAATLLAALTDTLPTGLVVATAPSEATTCTGGTITAVAAAGSFSLGAGAQIPANSSCTVSVNVQSATAGAYTNTLAAGSLQTNAGNNATAASDNLVVAGTFPAPYCTVTYGSGVEAITLVEFAGISNSSAATGGGAITNFLAIAGGTVAPRGAYPIRVKGNSDGNYTNYYRVYFDWNHDGVYAEENSERTDIGTITNSTGTDTLDVSALVVVPPTAKPGLTRMRVVKSYGSYGEGCGDNGYGQTEEYLVLVDSGLTPPPAPALVATAFSPNYLSAPSVATKYTVTLTNYNLAPLDLSAAFTHTFPASLTIATPANASTTCTNGTVTATPGAGGFSVSSATRIPADGNCTVSMDVTSASSGVYIDTIASGEVQTANGNNPAGAPATVQFASPTGAPNYATGFESPFTTGALNGQQGWTGRAATVATTAPASGTQHAVMTAVANATTTNQPLVISPAQPAGTAPYSSLSVKVRMTATTNGASWSIEPQDSTQGIVSTRLRFVRATSNIQIIDWTTSTYTTIPGTSWTAGTYMDMKFVIERATGAMKICKDGIEIYDDPIGNSVAGENITDLAALQVTGSGQTAGNTLFLDDVTIDNPATFSCSL